MLYPRAQLFINNFVSMGAILHGGDGHSGSCGSYLSWSHLGGSLTLSLVIN